MSDLMLDLETMDQTSQAAIISIGACFFELETGWHDEGFHVIVDVHSSINYGLTIGESTRKWWLRQSDEAKEIFISPDKQDLDIALDKFNQYIFSHCQKPFLNLKVWGNGAGFDNEIISNAYNKCDIKRPWAYWSDRDVRTMVDLGKRLFNFNPKKDMPFKGVEHNALSDAIHQANYISAIYQTIMGAE